MTVVKVIRLLGNSNESWHDAAATAVREAARTIRGIHGVEATDFTAEVDQNGEITEYRCTVNIAFVVQERERMGEEGAAEEAAARRGGGRSGARRAGDGTQARGGGRKGGGRSSGGRGR